MTEQSRIIDALLPFIPPGLEGIESLVELALDLRWSWNDYANDVWRQLDPVLWEFTHNPWVVLKTVSHDKLKQMINEPSFAKKIQELVQARRKEAAAEAWFQKNHPKSPLTGVAYFSMEYMLSEALPIYSGGLGNVAGDQLKAASDLGVPVIGIGLLYQQGYFRQSIGKDGSQQALYPYNDPGQLPVTPLRGSNGEWLRVETSLLGYSIWLRAWQAQVGRVKLYLLDSNDPGNFPVHRGITSELYGGGSELRLMQEVALGIGGWRLLQTLGIKPEVCHLNEGHAAFAILDRAYSFMKETGVTFNVALAATRAGNIFTTHTAVPAGFDRFSPALIEQFLGKYAQLRLGISLHELLALGRLNPNDREEPFNMAYLAMRGSGSANGVSRLHGKVSRKLFAPLFPGRPENEVPVGYVTNGIHTPSWESTLADKVWGDSCGKKRWLGELETIEKDFSCITDDKLWQMRNALRKNLVEFTRKRMSMQYAFLGYPPEEIKRIQNLFDPNTLTLGFARRFATYKRPNMLLHDPERLLRILSNPQKPVQLILAGKAHPADKPGQDLIQQWIKFIRTPEARSHVVFLSDYDMLLTENLVQGVDVWLNTPKRPWEACGTSGMKVLVNGGINLSELDGWWAEAFTPDVGWAIGDGKEHGDDAVWDAAEANALYDLLEKEVIPQFYNRNEDGIPVAWVAKMRESMTKLTPRFSANRSVREYTENYYLPAATNYRERVADKALMGSQIVQWQDNLKEKWTSLRFRALKVETKGDQHTFEVSLYLNGLNPKSVKVEIYADGKDGSTPTHQEMSLVRELPGEPSTFVYHASVPSTRSASEYTPRAVPHFPGVDVPLEATEILWQH